MTEYISPAHPRLKQWNLQDFEWRRIITTGELPAYNKSVEFIHEGNRLIDESTVKYRDWTDKELSTIRSNELSKGKTPFDIARYMGSIGKQVAILPPNTSIVRFSREKISYWLSRIVFKIDDALAFEAKRGIAAPEIVNPLHQAHESLKELGQSPAAPPEKPKPSYFRAIGKKGGDREKIKKPILEAVKTYMRINTAIPSWSNERIARQFCKIHNENKPMIVTLDEIKWETFCTGDHIFSRMSESYREKANNTELSIAYTTFQNRYIRRAKNDISADTAI